MHAITAIITQEMLTEPLLLLMSMPEINQISHSKDAVDLLHSVMERLVCEGNLNFDLVEKKTYVAKY